MITTIYHNPNCSKSRQTLALLQGRGIEPRIIEYLKTSPDPEEIRELLARLELPARALVRSGEKAYGERDLDGAEEDELVTAMSEDPRLIQRPIVVHGPRARLGRPPERILELFDD